MKLIQVHQVDENGKTVGLINRFTVDNMEAYEESTKRDNMTGAKCEHLRNKAMDAARFWTAYFLGQRKCVVKEVTKEQDRQWSMGMTPKEWA